MGNAMSTYPRARSTCSRNAAIASRPNTRTLESATSRYSVLPTPMTRAPRVSYRASALIHTTITTMEIEK